MLTKAILPSISERREEYLSRRRQLRAQQGLPPPTPEEDARVRAGLCIDGESTGIKTLMDLQADEQDTTPALRQTVFIKFSASCSLAQQPADVSPCFKVFKKKMNTLANPQIHITPPDYMGLVEQVCLAKMEPAARRKYCNWLMRLPTALSTAFTKGNICKSWEMAGIAPLSPLAMLRQSPALRQITKQQTAACEAAMSKLAPCMLEKGQLTEADMQAAVGPVLIFPPPPAHDKSGRKIHKPLEKLSLNRRRAVLPSHPAILTEYSGVAAKPQRAPKVCFGGVFLM